MNAGACTNFGVASTTSPIASATLNWVSTNTPMTDDMYTINVSRTINFSGLDSSGLINRISRNLNKKYTIATAKPTIKRLLVDVIYYILKETFQRFNA